MWKRIIDLLCCPICKTELDLRAFQQSSPAIAAEFVDLAGRLEILDDRFNTYVEEGLLLCHRCKIRYPITGGVPVLVPYTTPLHCEFDVSHAMSLRAMEASYSFPAQRPVTGEQFVLETFSKEWLSYDYDGVMWSMTYEDHEKRFLAEVGFRPDDRKRVRRFLEIGCGLGMTTYFAHKNYQADAIGVDLSLAVVPATQRFRGNPFLHFIQASAFYMPLKKAVADTIYSHGVLHHTYSTAEAFKALVPHCRPGGLFYLWVYGSGSKGGSLLRRCAYGLEAAVRPTIAKNSSSFFAKSFLTAVSLGYMAINVLQRLHTPRMQPYTYKRALHAARDRFTPLFAHRQDSGEVLKWFEEAGFTRREVVDWQTMPRADQANYRRNTGVRGWLAEGQERSRLSLASGGIR